jgi:hypothetical protein
MVKDSRIGTVKSTLRGTQNMKFNPLPSQRCLLCGNLEKWCACKTEIKKADQNDQPKSS